MRVLYIAEIEKVQMVSSQYVYIDIHICLFNLYILCMMKSSQTTNVSEWNLVKMFFVKFKLNIILIYTYKINDNCQCFIEF